MRERARPAPEATSRARPFIAGDPVRGVAALAVCCYHAALAAIVATRPGDRLSGFAVLGPAGPVISRFFLALPIFFVLSGYLIARPFVTAYLDGRPMPRPGPYFRNRVLRIVPAFWVIYAVVLALQGVTLRSIPDAVVGLGFAQNYRLNGVSGVLPQAWSVDVEVGFYALMPLGMWILAKLSRGLSSRRRIAVLAVLLVGIMFASVDLRSLRPGSSTWLLSPPATAYVFVPGVLLALAEPWARSIVKDSGHGRLLVWALVVTSLVAVVGDAALTPRGRLVIPGLLSGPRPLLETLGMGALVAALLVRQWYRGDCPMALDNRFIRWVGQRSYSFYLVHIAVLTGLAGVLSAGLTPDVALLALIGAGVPASLVIAGISYRLVERPFLALKSRPRVAPAPVAPSSPSVALAPDG